MCDDKQDVTILIEWIGKVIDTLEFKVIEKRKGFSLESTDDISHDGIVSFVYMKKV